MMTNSNNVNIELIKSYNQEKIIDMAKNEPDWHVRLVAVENIRDEKALKDILKDELTSAVAIKAMEHISDKEFLTDICLNHPDSHLRLATINRISDKSILSKEELSSLLEKMLLNDSDDFVLKSVCENPSLDNQEVLIEVATSSSNDLLQRQVIRKITDENILSDFALNNENPYIRREAIQNPNLIDVDAICEIIRLDCDEFNRIMAIYKIPNGESLLDIVYRKSLHHRLHEIAQNTNFPLNDYFLDVLENETDEYKRQVAVNFIKDKDILDDIVLTESNEDIRADAIKNNNFDSQDILERLITIESSPKVLFEVVSKIQNQELLIDFIKNNLEYNEVIVKAISKVGNLEAIEELSSHPDSRIRMETVKRISKLKNNDEMLLEIALAESDEGICLEAIDSMNVRNDLIDVADGRQERNIRISALNRIKPKRLLDNYRGFMPNSLNDLPFDATLRHMALNDDDLEVRKAATSKINDKEVLDEIISIDDAAAPVAQARLNTLFEDIKRIDNDFILKGLVESSDGDVSAMAQATLDDLETWENRIDQINEINDVDALKEIAKNDFNYFVRCEAEGKLEKLLFNIRLDEIGNESNQKKLKDIVRDEDFSFEIRRNALFKITDEDFLKIYERKLN